MDKLINIKIYFIVAFFICFINGIKSQSNFKNNKILYCIDSSNQNKIDSALKTCSLIEPIIVILEERQDTIRLLFTSTDNDSLLKKVSKITNRFFVINNNYVPIVFWSDFYYSNIFIEEDESVITNTNYKFNGLFVEYIGRYKSGRISVMGYER